MKLLPYRATTRTGDTFEIDFPLHRDTVDPVRIWQPISDILKSIDRSLAIGDTTSNGDVLQAIAMAMAVRARAVHTPPETSARLAIDLLRTALDAAADAAVGPCLVKRIPRAANVIRRVIQDRVWTMISRNSRPKSYPVNLVSAEEHIATLEERYGDFANSLPSSPQVAFTNGPVRRERSSRISSRRPMALPCSPSPDCGTAGKIPRPVNGFSPARSSCRAPAPGWSLITTACRCCSRRRISTAGLTARSVPKH